QLPVLPSVGGNDLNSGLNRESICACISIHRIAGAGNPHLVIITGRCAIGNRYAIRTGTYGNSRDCFQDTGAFYEFNSYRGPGIACAGPVYELLSTLRPDLTTIRRSDGDR